VILPRDWAQEFEEFLPGQCQGLSAAGDIRAGLAGAGDAGRRHRHAPRPAALPGLSPRPRSTRRRPTSPTSGATIWSPSCSVAPSRSSIRCSRPESRCATSARGLNVLDVQDQHRDRSGRSLACPMVVSMRPLTPGDAIRAGEISGRFPDMHGAPVHIGDPAAIGIRDIAAPDYGDAVTIEPGEQPVFWACGVTPQAAIEVVRPEFCNHPRPGLHADHRQEVRPDLAAEGGRRAAPPRHERETGEMRRIFATMVAALALGSGAAQADIPIALVGPMTGSNATFGEQLKKGAQQAVDDINARGGVLGQKLALTIADDRVRSEAGGRGRQSNSPPGTSPSSPSFLLRLVDPGVGDLQRGRHPADLAGLDGGRLDRGCVQEGLEQRLSRLRSRRSAGPGRRRLCRRSFQG